MSNLDADNEHHHDTQEPDHGDAGQRGPEPPSFSVVVSHCHGFVPFALIANQARAACSSEVGRPYRLERDRAGAETTDNIYSA